MTKNDAPTPEIRNAIQKLQMVYVPNDHYERFDTLFRMLLDQRRADLVAGVPTNVRGIALIGLSGSGKSSAARQLLRANKDLILAGQKDGKCEIVSLQVPSPATMKFVGSSILSALGYPLSTNKSAPLIWNMVKERLAMRQTLFLHLDEAQDLTRYQTDNERQSVINTLKSLMDNPNWPVGLILTGMPELKDLINKDPQLARRFYPVELTRLDPDLCSQSVIELVANYADLCGVVLDDSIQCDVFSRRLMHAAGYNFGLVNELIVQSLTLLLLRTGLAVPLAISNFAAAYRMRTGAMNGQNPFVAKSFARIDVSKILGDR